MVDGSDCVENLSNYRCVLCTVWISLLHVLLRVLLRVLLHVLLLSKIERFIVEMFLTEKIIKVKGEV